MPEQSEKKQVRCTQCHKSIEVTRKTLTHKWDGFKWQHASFGGWLGSCPNGCGFVSGDSLFAYGLRPQLIGVVL